MKKLLRVTSAFIKCRFKEEDELTEEAIQVLHRPQLENMLQKLEEFEVCTIQLI